MLGKIAKATQRILVISYPAATALGLIYAYSYYDVFDIEVLNFSTPLDLLLVALANAEKVAIILVLAAVMSLLLFLVIAALAQIVQLLIVTKTAISIFFIVAGVLLKAIIPALWFVLLILVAALAPMVFVLLFVSVVGIFALAVVLGKLRQLVSALGSGERVKHGDFWKAYDVAKTAHPLMRFGHYRAVLGYPFGFLPTAWSKTKAVASDFYKVLPNAYSKLKKRFQKARDLIRKLWGWVFRNCKPIFLIMLGAISLYVAWGSGIADAERMIENNSACGICDLSYHKTMLSWPFRERDDSQGQPKFKAFVIPTLNMASLEFLPACGRPKNDGSGANSKPLARKYVRIAIRQDARAAGPTNLPSCLVHVGATDSAQFLLGIGDKGPSLPDDATPLPDDAKSCDLVARVGPFASGLDSMPGGPWIDDACRNKPGQQKPCDRTKLTNIDGLLDKIQAQMKRGLVPVRMFLIGRADSQPINDICFRSNSGLAQSRADWVWEQLQGEEWAVGVHSVQLSAGPHTAGDPPDAFDRSVEVHVCWKPRAKTAASPPKETPEKPARKLQGGVEGGDEPLGGGVMKPVANPAARSTSLP